MTSAHAAALARNDMLTDLQRESFAYFLHEQNLANGMVLDKTSRDWPASIAAIGMALTAYPIGVERGFIARTDAVARTLTTLRFLATSEQSEAPDATGHRGFYYHFLDMETGRRAWQCELSSIDTAILIAGVSTAAAYFQSSGTINPVADRVETPATAEQKKQLAALAPQHIEASWTRRGKDHDHSRQRTGQRRTDRRHQGDHGKRLVRRSAIGHRGHLQELRREFRR